MAVASRRRRFSALPLVGISLALAVLPGSLTQKARLTVLAGLRPFEKGADLALSPLRALFGRSEDSGLRAELDYLNDQVRRQANEIAILRNQLEAAGVLQPYVREHRFRLLAADVLLPSDASSWRKSLVLARGVRDGARPGQLVVYNHQLVGRILEAGPWTCRVQVVTDPAFRAAAVATPQASAAGVTFEQRHVGLYEGTAGPNGRLKWITGEVPVGRNSYVLTTEDPPNGVPRGLILGRIARMSSNREASLRADVEPILEFRALEHVMILVQDPPP
ncbi:MAG: rod shape-determining protein MreC [Planctomycetota bacterium]